MIPNRPLLAESRQFLATLFQAWQSFVENNTEGHVIWNYSSMHYSPECSVEGKSFFSTASFLLINTTETVPYQGWWKDSDAGA
jgi:hypothetical protein